MARVLRTAQTIPGGYPAVLPVPIDTLDVTFTAADAANKERVVWAEGLTIIARNSGAVDRTITITSTPLNGRTGDLGPYIVGAGQEAMIIKIPASGFRQANGELNFEASHAEMLIAQVILP